MQFMLVNRTSKTYSFHHDDGRIIDRGDLPTLPNGEITEKVWLNDWSHKVQIIETTSQPVPADDPEEQLAIASYRSRKGRSV